MRKLKDLMVTVGALVLVMYALSVTGMSIYYGWKDIKSSDSFVRFVFISPFVGFYKATHWPYYVFFENNDTEIKAEKKVQDSIKAFFNGYQYLNDANVLITNIMNSKNFKKDFNRSMVLLENAKERFKECEKKVLNKIYNNWGDLVFDKYIPAINFILSGIKNNDQSDLARSDALLAESNDWLENNWNEILKTLNAKYGVEIKKRNS